MKGDFAFLYPQPRSVRFVGGSLDIRRLSFPLEIGKKFDFLFRRFSVRGHGRGLEVVFQERDGIGPEEYAIECAPGRIVLSAAAPQGRFYALATLLQVLAHHGESGRLPAFILRDSPEVAFRGFMLPLGAGGPASPAELRDLLLELALLKFNHFAMPAAAVEGDGLKALSDLARKAGMEILLLDRDPRSVFRLEPPGTGRGLPDGPFLFKAGRDGEAAPESRWFEFLMEQYRAARAEGKRTAAWADGIARHPEWIRKLPQDVVVLNRLAAPERGAPFQATAAPFRRHHVRQVLCPVLCARGRLIADARAGMARIGAAFTAARAWRLDGVMAVAGEEEGDLCLPASAVMGRFHAGCLLWSGRPPGPAAFSLWAVGRDEPDLFRVFTFLAQAEHRLPYAHGRYLFEDPVAAPFSRPGDPREVVAHFRKAALYLKKREVAAGGLTGFIDFAREMYSFIAAKVEFSQRLAAMLEREDGGGELAREAERLRRAALQLKGFYLDLLPGDLRPAGPARGESGFDLLAERLERLIREASSTEGRRKLSSAAGEGPPLDPPASDR